MGICASCFKKPLEGFAGFEGEVTMGPDTPSPNLGRKGEKIQIDKSGKSASGAGLAQCAVELEQDKAYWETRVRIHHPPPLQCSSV
jgi:hypothetical protein